MRASERVQVQLGAGCIIASALCVVVRVCGASSLMEVLAASGTLGVEQCSGACESESGPGTPRVAEVAKYRACFLVMA